MGFFAFVINAFFLICLSVLAMMCLGAAFPWAVPVLIMASAIYLFGRRL